MGTTSGGREGDPTRYPILKRTVGRARRGRGAADPATECTLSDARAPSRTQTPAGRLPPALDDATPFSGRRHIGSLTRLLRRGGPSPFVGKLPAPDGPVDEEGPSPPLSLARRGVRLLAPRRVAIRLTLSHVIDAAIQ